MPMPDADWKKTSDAITHLHTLNDQLNNIGGRAPRAAKALADVAKRETDAKKKAQVKKAIDALAAMNKQIKVSIKAVDACWAAADKAALAKYQTGKDYRTAIAKPLAALKSFDASAHTFRLNLITDPVTPKVYAGNGNVDVKVTVESLEKVFDALNDFRIKLNKV